MADFPADMSKIQLLPKEKVLVKLSSLGAELRETHATAPEMVEDCMPVFLELMRKVEASYSNDCTIYIPKA